MPPRPQHLEDLQLSVGHHLNFAHGSSLVVEDDRTRRTRTPRWGPPGRSAGPSGRPGPTSIGGWRADQHESTPSFLIARGRLVKHFAPQRAANGPTDPDRGGWPRAGDGVYDDGPTSGSVVRSAAWDDASATTRIAIDDTTPRNGEPAGRSQRLASGRARAHRPGPRRHRAPGPGVRVGRRVVWPLSPPTTTRLPRTPARLARPSPK